MFKKPLQIFVRHQNGDTTHLLRHTVSAKFCLTVRLCTSDSASTTGIQDLDVGRKMPSRSRSQAGGTSSRYKKQLSMSIMTFLQIGTGSLQRVCVQMHTAINGTLDAISSISSAMQRLSAGLAEPAMPYRINDLIPKICDDSHDRGLCRNFMAELHLWMQAWSDQGERIFVRVESVDKVERSILAVDCTEAYFRTLETTNEPLRVFNRCRSKRGFEAWRLI